MEHGRFGREGKRLFARNKVMPMKMFAEKQREWETLLIQAADKLKLMTRAQPKRFVSSHGPRKISTAEPSSDVIVAKEQ